MHAAGGRSGAVHGGLARLQQRRLVVQTVLGTQKHDQANAQAPIFAELRGIVAKRLGPADALRQALAPIADAVHLALLYGSVAKRSDTAHSDFDLLLVSDTLTLEQVYATLASAEQHLGRPVSPPRSEEHTSELQSLMRISYAVFGLKKKKNTQSY